MIGWLIYRKEDAIANHSYINWFKQEAEKQQICLKLVYFEQLTIQIETNGSSLKIEGHVIDKPDFVIIRTMGTLLQKQFETMKITTFNNAETAGICNHKILTYLEMQKIKVSMMPTVLISTVTPPEEPPFNYPFILKSATGHGGTNVYWIDNEDKWKKILKTTITSDYLAQSCKDIQTGKDVRVFVIGKQIIAAVLRSNDNDFRANFKLGGKASLFELTPMMEATIKKIINHFNFGMVGIDFLLHNDGNLVFNEIEDVVGSRILSATTNINLLEKYITHIKQTVETAGK